MATLHSIGSEKGILSDLEILARIVALDEDKLIFISPLLDVPEQLGPASLDLRLGTDLLVAGNIAQTHIDLAYGHSTESLQEQTDRYMQERSISEEGSFVLHPSEFALASTLEYLKLPQDIAGRLEGRSTWGRLGLQVHVTAGFVDPGFEGNLTYELINLGKLPIKLFPGIRLGQICFFRVEGVEVSYMHKKTSKYGGSHGVRRARLDQEVEISTRSKR